MDKLKEFLKGIGFSEEQQAKIEAGEIEVNEAVKAYTEGFESTVKSRIEQSVIDSKKSELFAASYNRLEKMVADTFQLDAEKYKDVESKNRLSTMLKDVNDGFSSKLTEVEGKFKGANADTIKDIESKFTRMLEAEKTAKSSELKALQDQLASALNEKEQIIVNNYKSNAMTKYLKGIENPAYEYSIMETLLDAGLQKYGIKIEEDKAFLTGTDGTKMVHPEKPNELFTLEDYFSIEATAKGFAKQSHGDTGGTFNLGKTKESLQQQGVHPNAIKELQRMNNK